MMRNWSTLRGKDGAVVGAALLCTCISSGVQAVWIPEGNVQVESHYDDNVRLTTDGGEESAIVTTTGGEMRLGNVTERSEVTAILGGSLVSYTAYDGFEDLHNEDVEYADIRSSWRGTRARWGMDGSVRRDVLLETVGDIGNPLGTASGTAGGQSTTRGSESGRVVPGNGDPSVGIDSGSTEEQVRRVRTWVSPFLGYQLSEKTGVQLGYTYLGLDYDKQTTTGLEDSKSNGVSLDVWNQVNERDTARFGVRAVRFDPSEEPESTDAYEMTVGWDRRLSERLRISLDVGGQRSERDSDSYSGYLARFNLFRRTDTGAMRVRFEHSLEPSGYGDLVKTDTLDLNYEFGVSDRLGFGLNGNAYRVRNSSNQISDQNNDRDYVEIGPDVRYALTTSVHVGAFYKYRWVDRQDEGSGSSNAVGIQVSYQPGGRPI